MVWPHLSPDQAHLATVQTGVHLEMTKGESILKGVDVAVF